VLLQTRGQCVRDFARQIRALARPHLLAGGPLGRMARSLTWRAVQWNLLTLRLMLQARRDKEQVGAAAYEYLMYSGFVMMGYHWAQMAFVADAALKKGQGPESEAFYRAKIETAQFYFERLLPRANAHHRMALAPAATLLQTPAEHLAPV
ncbi:MAG: acyl-CoA dehydrogenase C-terminal domain-containing protein, partial [Limnohabitans sp.]